jgi:hypothetical protein
VHSAQEGVATATHDVEAAYRGVTKAQEAVTRAEQGVEDAVYRVGQAQDNVTIATQRRLSVSQDAAQKIHDDYQTEQDDLLAVGLKLQDAAAKGELNATAAKNWADRLNQVAQTMTGPVASAIQQIYQAMLPFYTAQFPAANSGDLGNRVGGGKTTATGFVASGSTSGPAATPPSGSGSSGGSGTTTTARGRRSRAVVAVLVVAALVGQRHLGRPSRVTVR